MTTSKTTSTKTTGQAEPAEPVTEPKPTVSGTLGALTYAEETAIRKRFDVSIESLLKRDTGRTAGRAIFFAHMLLQGVAEKEAFATATKTPYAQVDAVFAEESEDFDEDEPDTDEGKGDSPSA